MSMNGELDIGEETNSCWQVWKTSKESVNKKWGIINYWQNKRIVCVNSVVSVLKWGCQSLEERERCFRDGEKLREHNRLEEKDW